MIAPVSSTATTVRNFVQLVLHQVFDPVLKEAASFVSGLIGLLTGRGGLVTAGAWAFGGLLLKLTGTSAAGGATGEAAYALASSATATGSSDTIATLGSVGSALSTLYSVVARATGLPSLLDGAAGALAYLGQVAGLYHSRGSDGHVLVGAAFGGASGASTSGAGVGALSGLTAGAGIGAGIVLAIPALIGFLDGLGKAKIEANNYARSSAQASLANDQLARIASVAGGPDRRHERRLPH